MIGHVGNKVGALVDGQLAATETERLWSHVVACRACQEAVTREGWVKTRLAGLRRDTCQPPAPNYLRAVLDAPHSLRQAGPALPAPDARSDSRRAVAVAVLGAGSIGAAALVGVMALALPIQQPTHDRRGPASSLTRVSEGPATVSPVSATGGTVSAPLSSTSDQARPSPVRSIPDWVRTTK